MAKKKTTRTAKPTFEVRFVGPGLSPEKVPLGAVNEALSAIQDIASGRDPFEDGKVPFERGIGLVDVSQGSAVYSCMSRAPDDAIANLNRVGAMLANANGNSPDDGDLIAALPPIRSLSQIAKNCNCRVEVTAAGRIRKPLIVVHQDDYTKISDNLFIKGETTITGKIVRAGGATSNRCLLRVPGRRKLLYCDVNSRDLARRLGHHLYEDIAAKGIAVWIHRTWRVYEFTISDFTQPSLSKSKNLIQELRDAGLSAWDDIHDPEDYIQEMRS